MTNTKPERENRYFEGSRNMNNDNKSQMKQFIEFNYDYDFDENGIFYYLGSFGKQKQWQNPQLLGQIKVFFSKIRSGNVSDFVGRDVVNCSTHNEKNSYMGVDLGTDRYLN